MTNADRLAHEFGSYVRVSPEIAKTVDRFKALSLSIDRALSRDSYLMTTSEIIDLRDMQEERARIYVQLEAAGQLHLVVAS